ncbi:uncharacterized protein EI90DRAFT_2838619, partial [Cantharellus anzutake]|uniref:uncharacterized protein n=1 Tax=Cantharellus anzutake TaxID=1750568 RepID=UPI0019040381
TWATLAASKPASWGATLAPDSKGNASGTSSPGERNLHPMVTVANNITSAQCFVKGVDDKINLTLMKEILTSRFGPIKELDVVASKGCAFLEFTTVEAARRAIMTSLPPNVGGEGGIRIIEGDPQSIKNPRGVPRIQIETRKERADRPPSRPNRGAPNGPFRGGPGRGRGGP